MLHPDKFPLSPLPQCLLHPIPFLPISIPSPFYLPSEKSRPPRDINRTQLNKLKKTEHIPSHQGWTKHPGGKKRAPPRSKRELGTAPAPTVRVSTGTPSCSAVTCLQRNEVRPFQDP